MITQEQLNTITDVDVAFSTTKLLPEMKNIPEEFKHNGTKWNKLFSTWFFSGLKELKVTPKKGIDSNSAIKCIKAHMGSFAPSHQHKEAGVAFMMSQLFEDAEWS